MRPHCGLYFSIFEKKSKKQIKEETATQSHQKMCPNLFRCIDILSLLPLRKMHYMLSSRNAPLPLLQEKLSKNHLKLMMYVVYSLEKTSSPNRGKG